MAEVADLPGANQIGEGAEGFAEVGVRVVAVDLVEIDPVGVQALQRVLDLAGDPAAGVAALIAFLTHRHVDLAGQDHVVTPAPCEVLCRR